jgi:regulator of sirC expression with transglutaminase-like and TPR domain
MAILPAVARGQGPDAAAPSPAVSVEQIRALVAALDSPQFSQRDLATRKLQDLGEAAYEELLAATGHSSREVRSRAASILKGAQYRTLLREFEKLSGKSDARIDVEYGMWLIARILNPRVQRATLQKPLDDLARRVRVRLGPNVDVRKVPPAQALETLRLVLYEEQRFAGNERDYTNPENSSLEFVLANRRGLPIMMSHVMIAVAHRLEWPLVGVPLPGRYIVRYDSARAPEGSPKEDLYFDAFAGRAMTLEDLARQFGQRDVEALIEGSTNRQILIRMMNNLESHLSLRGRGDQAELALACRLALESQAEEELE